MICVETANHSKDVKRIIILTETDSSSFTSECTVLSISGLSSLVFREEDLGFLFNLILIKAKPAAGCFPI